MATHSEGAAERGSGPGKTSCDGKYKVLSSQGVFVRAVSCTSPRHAVNAFGQGQDSLVPSGFSTLLHIASKYCFPCKIVARLVLLFFFS